MFVSWQMLHDVLGDARAEEMLKNVERQRGAKVAQQPHNKVSAIPAMCR